MIRRLITCDIPGCSEQLLEKGPGDGWPEWGSFHGIKLNGIENPCLCPHHISKTAEFVADLDKVH